MSHRCLAVLAFCFLPGSLSAQEAPLSLESALQSAERTNLTVLISREALAEAIADAQNERAGLLPRIDAEAEQRRSRNVQISGRDPVLGQPFNRFDARVAGTFTVLSPAQIASYRAARKAVDVAEFDHEQALQDVLTSLGSTFFRHLRNVQRLEVLDANILRARALLEMSQRQLAAGVATQIDVTRAEAQLALAEQARLQQETLVYQSELSLKRFLDMEPSRPLQLVPFAVRRMEQSAYNDGEDATHAARRADLQSERAELERIKTEWQSYKWERFGALSLFGEYGYASNRAFDGKEENQWIAGANFSVPIFDGLRIRANRRAALARVRAQEFRLRAFELLVSSELRLAVQDARSRFAQVLVAERNLRLADDELRLARRRYEEGVADNRELIEAQNRLAVAGDNHVEAVFQYHLSRLELARSRGDVRSILAERAE